ncbi:unannotated protein [freshwater metagenome]|uniref:Unannotated protein n=1 Tax=freshwater metagenome TaxID=449393 RepID=A0A6J6LFJ0_9ZZZZ
MQIKIIIHNCFENDREFIDDRPETGDLAPHVLCTLTNLRNLVRERSTEIARIDSAQFLREFVYYSASVSDDLLEFVYNY